MDRREGRKGPGKRRKEGRKEGREGLKVRKEVPREVKEVNSK